MNEQKEFEAWWDQDCDTTGNPYSNMSMMYWAWEAWKAGRKGEQEAIATEFMKRHEAVKHLNNYWHHAANYVRARGQHDKLD
jgi:hypothetical protein